MQTPPPKYYQNPETTSNFYLIVGLEIGVLAVLIIAFYCQVCLGSELQSVHRPSHQLEQSQKRRQSTEASINAAIQDLSKTNERQRRDTIVNQYDQLGVNSKIGL